MVKLKSEEGMVFVKLLWGRRRVVNSVKWVSSEGM